jgi:2-polyprenyl-3-methyl-5-hydroxy-6-metoxy-1,4-benzoquinol methylase
VKTKTVPCDLCGSAKYRVLFVKEGFPHVRCLSCGLVFVNPRLEHHIEAQRVSGTGTMGEERLSDSQVKRIRKELASFEPYRRLNRIVEGGAGRGWFLGEAAKAGWETWAVEINNDALGYLRNQGIARVIVEPAEEFSAPPGAVDVVRMWDVIEHLESPRRAVERIFQVLRPGGLIRLATTNFASLSRRVNGAEWVYLNGADHVVLFDPETITRLLREVGFTDIRINTRSFNMRRKLYHPEQELSVGLHPLRPFRKLVDEAIRFTKYGHQLIVVGSKPL